MKPALLIIDMQKEFYKYGPATARSLDEAIECINAAIDLFREKHLPIVCIQHMSEERNLVPGQEGFEVLEKLNILATDWHLHKTYGNSFNKTELASGLRELGVDAAIITGFCAEYCVLSTYRGAQDIDLTPVILREALASTRPEHIPFVEAISEVISFGALRKMLG